MTTHFQAQLRIVENELHFTHSNTAFYQILLTNYIVLTCYAQHKINWDLSKKKLKSQRFRDYDTDYTFKLRFKAIELISHNTSTSIRTHTHSSKYTDTYMHKHTLFFYHFSVKSSQLNFDTLTQYMPMVVTSGHVMINLSRVRESSELRAKTLYVCC